MQHVSPPSPLPFFGFWDIFKHKIKLQPMDGNTPIPSAALPPAARGVAEETHDADFKAKTLINRAVWWLLCCKTCDFLPESKWF